jgi:hypothetical protein
MRFYALLIGMAALALTSSALADGSKQAPAPKVNKAGKKDKAPNKGQTPNKANKVGKNDKVNANKSPKVSSTIPNNGAEPGETKKTLKNPAHHEAQAKSNKTLFHAFNVLQSTKVMLQKSNHDYGGNRVAAVQSIGVAQGQLRLALGKYGKNIPPAAAGKAGAGKESQKTSNAQLNHAIKTIRSTITELANANHDYYGHRAAAVRDLEGTLQQLQTALKFANPK